MTKSVPALLGLVVVLVVSLPAMTITAAGPSPAPGPTDGAPAFVTITTNGDHVEIANSTNRLALDRDGVHASSLATPSPDLGTVFASQDTSLEYDYEWHTFQETWESNPNEREEMTFDTLDRIEAGFETLHDREQAIVEAHAAGEASDDELFRVIAQNYHEAQDLERFAERIIDWPDDRFGVQQSWFRMNSDLYTSPLRAEIADAVHGEERPEFDAVAIETSETGLVLETITDGEYVREAVRYDNRDPTSPDVIDGNSSMASSLATEFYPWTFEESGIRTHLSPPFQLYRVEPTQSQADLSVYLDGATERVYHEHQRLPLSALPIEGGETWTDDSLNVTLEMTPAEGPMLVTATDDGEPVEATVAIDGVELGATDDDEELWVVPPADADELTVETDDGVVSVHLADD